MLRRQSWQDRAVVVSVLWIQPFCNSSLSCVFYSVPPATTVSRSWVNSLLTGNSPVTHPLTLDPTHSGVVRSHVTRLAWQWTMCPEVVDTTMVTAKENRNQDSGSETGNQEMEQWELGTRIAVRNGNQDTSLCSQAECWATEDKTPYLWLESLIHHSTYVLHNLHWEPSRVLDTNEIGAVWPRTSCCCRDYL